MISVAMATYNGEKYIVEQLDSICNQSHKIDELVIVDDCSTDNTWDVVNTYMTEHPDAPIILRRNTTNLGYKKNFREAMTLCKGDIIFLCDQDDIWVKHKVEVLMEKLNTRSDISVVSSSFIQINGAGEVIKKHGGSSNRKMYQRNIRKDDMVCVPLEDLMFHNISQGCSVAMRKEIRDLYLEYFTDAMPHDWMINVIAAMRNQLLFLNMPLFYYRIHGKNAIGFNDNLTLDKKNTLAIRTANALWTMAILDFIKNMDNNFYQGNKWLEDIRSFIVSHVLCLEKGDFKGLCLQNFNPYYRKLKTIKGRILDLYFVLQNRKREE